MEFYISKAEDGLSPMNPKLFTLILIMLLVSLTVHAVPDGGDSEQMPNLGMRVAGAKVSETYPSAVGDGAETGPFLSRKADPGGPFRGKKAFGPHHLYLLPRGISQAYHFPEIIAFEPDPDKRFELCTNVCFDKLKICFKHKCCSSIYIGTRPQQCVEACKKVKDKCLKKCQD